MYWALVKNGVVDNVIVSDDDYAQTYINRDAYDAVVKVTDLEPRPGPGWLYDGSTFADPNPPDQTEAPPPQEVLDAQGGEG